MLWIIFFNQLTSDSLVLSEEMKIYNVALNLLITAKCKKANILVMIFKMLHPEAQNDLLFNAGSNDAMYCKTALGMFQFYIICLP